MVDKYDSMLRDPPAKHSLKGKYVKGASAPPPVSMHTKGRYVAPDQVRSIHWSPYDRVRRGERRSLRTFPGVVSPLIPPFQSPTTTPFNSN